MLQGLLNYSSNQYTMTSSLVTTTQLACVHYLTGTAVFYRARLKAIFSHATKAKL
jgi:hypothetical protein